MPRTQNQSTQSTGTVDHQVGDASGTGHVTEPRMPERTRILRPGLWVEAMVAMLSDFAFRLYLGLMTCADDEGWLLWRPSTLAAHLLRFTPVGRREAALEKGAAELSAAGLLVVHDCGCAYSALPKPGLPREGREPRGYGPPLPRVPRESGRVRTGRYESRIGIGIGVGFRVGL